ncbi:hypothetical protein LCGC14_3121980 [marine sediment metagenome]|uniref:Uncharacterized protein n=1 Tax=marine sediment metagenome TaxID=412755 RepID=A0A0F8W294_9ZZZZ
MLVNLLLRRLRRGDAVPVARPFSAFLPLIGGLGNFRVRFFTLAPKNLVIATPMGVANLPVLRIRFGRLLTFDAAALPIALPNVKVEDPFASLPAPLIAFFTAFLNIPIAVFLSLVPHISVISTCISCSTTNST